MGFILTAIFVCVVIGLAAIPIILFNGWVLGVLWTWFLVPIGAPVITVPIAAGICLIVGFLTMKVTLPEERTTSEKVTLAACQIIAPLLALMIGWIVKLFM